MTDVAAFYDDLSDVYHLVYDNWPASIERQGDTLAHVIRERHPTAATVADVACGIGTQTLGLGARGFRIVASDLSPRAVERARREADARGIVGEFRVDDMRLLSTYGNQSADVLIACDNSVPHLLTDDEILAAFRRFREVLKPGGLCAISVRDYTAEERTPVRLIPYGVRRHENARVIIFQVWVFDGELYDLSFYFTFDDGVRVSTRVFRCRYYAIPIDRLAALMAAAGFVNVERIDGVFFQPLLVARERA